MDKRDKDREDTCKSDREQTHEILKSKLPYIFLTLHKKTKEGFL